MKITNHERNIILTAFTIGSFIIGGLFLFANLMQGIGAQKERESKECVGATAINMWQETLKNTKAICVDGFNNYKADYENKIAEAEKDVKYWKEAYLWLKKQNELKEKQKNED